MTGDADEATLAALGAALADAVEQALPGWVAAGIRTGAPGTPAADVESAGQAALADVMPLLRALLALDVDEQRQGPLAVVRRAARYPTELLRRQGVPPVDRDDRQRALFPDDDYNLAPARFADLGPAVGEAGITWGAAKAYVHRRRHDRPGS